MKGSIRRELFLAITLVAVVFVSLLGFLNLFFYDDYYMHTKKKDLVRMYSAIDAAYEGDLKAVADTLSAIEDTGGVRVLISDRSGRELYPFYYASIAISGQSFGRSFTILTPAQPPGGEIPGWAGRFSYDEKEYAEKGYTFSAFQDKRSELQFVSLVGRLQNGDRLTLRLPVAYVEESTAFSNLFLLLTSIVSLFLCLGVAYLLSRRFSKPLSEIREVATALSELSFEKKYTGNRTDEIGKLGESVNLLSVHLESAIGKLKETNRRLAGEIEEKQKIDDMRKEFIVNVSHELKTPIALIQGYAEGLYVNISSSEEDKNDYCEVIIDEAKRMNKLVMQLLSLSKVELGNVKPEISELELSFLGRRVMQKARVLAQQKNLSLEAGDLDFLVSGDFDMTEQVLTNYLTNAICHTPENGKIALSATEKDGLVRVFVQNEGENIPDEEILKIWEKFYKIDKSRSRESGGTGIGLSVVRAYMEAQGGGYGVQNLAGGVEFYFELPGKRAAR